MLACRLLPSLLTNACYTFQCPPCQSPGPFGPLSTHPSYILGPCYPQYALCSSLPAILSSRTAVGLVQCTSFSLFSRFFWVSLAALSCIYNKTSPYHRAVMSLVYTVYNIFTIFIIAATDLIILIRKWGIQTHYNILILHFILNILNINITFIFRSVFIDSPPPSLSLLFLHLPQFLCTLLPHFLTSFLLPGLMCPFPCHPLPPPPFSTLVVFYLVSDSTPILTPHLHFSLWAYLIQLQKTNRMSL